MTIEAQALARRVVVASTARVKGGVWRHIRDLGTGLREVGCDVTLALQPDAEQLHRAADDAGLVWQPLHRTVRWRNAVWHVHLHDTYDPIVLAAVAARRLIGPTVITEHLPRNHAADPRLEAHHPRRPGAYTAKTVLKRAEFRLSSRVIAVGVSSSRFLSERYSLDPDTIDMVHNGIAPPPGAPEANSLAGPLRVFASGHSGRQKGIDVLLDAVARSPANWELTIAGSGLEDGSASRQSAPLPEGRVRFLGWVDDPHRFVTESNVVCMPSRWESFPYAALEALALGRPVVGSRVDGLDEIIGDDDSCGLLVDADRPDELAATLDRLASDEALVMRLSAGARRRAESFPLAGMISGTLRVYRAACGPAPRRRSRDA